jgi:hypothetical protein
MSLAKSTRFLFIFSLFCTSCYRPCSKAYQEFYQHLSQPCPIITEMSKTDYFLVILVDARHLDYTNNWSFFRTIAKHPSDGSKNGDFGHAWIYVEGLVNGKKIAIEGGHSGERGLLQAKYFDGIMNYNDWGYANPTPEQKLCPRYEPNPAKYLWTSQNDGFFQKGSGDHTPTFAVKINLSKNQFQQILKFIHPRCYPYQRYALTRHQCSSFVAEVASLADLYLDCEVSISIQPRVLYGGRWVRFWEDPQYALLTFSSPDQLEKSLMKAVNEGQAEYALDWYLKNKS